MQLVKSQQLLPEAVDLCLLPALPCTCKHKHQPFNEHMNAALLLLQSTAS